MKGRKILTTWGPWAITLAALYYAFRNVHLGELATSFSQANPWWISLAVVLTILSYVLRAGRWRVLFPEPVIQLADSYKVLVLGFFMNNVLPARTGELVRAHMGSKVTGSTRTHVLGTIASERLADGLTISILFVIFSYHLKKDQNLENLFYVSCLFGVAAFGVIAVLACRNTIFSLIEWFAEKFNTKLTEFTSERVRVFIEALHPLTNMRRIPLITIWSLIIWFIELGVYWAVSQAFDFPLTLPFCVLFMVSVNFSSLIPAAPGALGVIEAIATSVLVSVIPGLEFSKALSMVIAQHAIQFAVVGIPGLAILSTWKTSVRQIEEQIDAE